MIAIGDLLVFGTELFVKPVERINLLHIRTFFSGVQYIVEGIIALPPSKPLEKEMGRRKNNRSLILRRRLGRKAGVTEEI